MPTTAARIDVVFIRKSTQTQDDQGQRLNVTAMLRDAGVYVPDGNWFVGTVSRRKVKANAAFNRLMALVEDDKIGTVYVESQDRWGTADRVELFSLLGTLRQHGTRLYDLRAKRDLTERDFATEMLAILGSFKSENELKDTSYRSLRSRVQNFRETGTWPTGTHPYGYGKRCFSAAGDLLWEWQPYDRSHGQLYYPNEDGGLKPVGPPDARLPRKSRTDRIQLVPSTAPGYVRAVKLVFDLYTRVGLSRRQISARLNAEGLRFNGGEFTHPDVTNILDNPAYTGDTYFGKNQSGELHTFDEKGLVVKAERRGAVRRRDVAECIVMQNTHDPLIDRPTWELARQKREAERERTSHAPRNPDYYLKQIFVCGHCGKSMAARTEIDRDSRKKYVRYVCSTYIAGRCNGHPVSCGYHRINHEEAEQLLLDKIAELNLPYAAAASAGARANIQERLARLGYADDEAAEQWQAWFSDGINALAAYLAEEFPEVAEYPQILKLRKLAFSQYAGDLDDEPDHYRPFAVLPIDLAAVRAAVHEAEAAVVKQAREKLTALEAEHAAYTRAWVRATSELQQKVLKADMDRLEAEIATVKPRTVPLSQRVAELQAAEAVRQAEREKLLAEWPALENREKGEAPRRLFRTVTLYWKKRWQPAAGKPTRPLKTDRPGRWRYELQRDKIEWAFAVSDSETFR
jgi:DNA invertase Pin-like site-specific DNA recombinase